MLMSLISILFFCSSMRMRLSGPSKSCVSSRLLTTPSRWKVGFSISRTPRYTNSLARSKPHCAATKSCSMSQLAALPSGFRCVRLSRNTATTRIIMPYLS